MRHLKALLAAATALVLAACSNPQYLIHPTSNPMAAETRQDLDKIIDTSSFKPLVFGSFLFPAKGKLFRPVLPTDSRNAIVYVYRPQSEWADDEIQTPGFFLNGQFISGLKSGSYFWFEVPASTYYFNAKRPLAVFYFTTVFEADLTLEGGKNYYFRYDEENPGPDKPEKGAPMLVVGPLHQLPQGEAMPEIRQTRVMGPGRVVFADYQPKWAPFDFYPGAKPVPADSLDATSPRLSDLRSEDQIREEQGANADADADQTAPGAGAAPAAPVSAPAKQKHWWNPLSW
jgi:hypothetical protein